MWFNPFFELIIQLIHVHHLKGDLIIISINQISMLHRSYGCLNDKVYIIALKIYRSYLRGGSNQNKLNFGLVWFLYGPNSWYQFSKKSELVRISFVDLVWSDPSVFLSTTIIM